MGNVDISGAYVYYRIPVLGGIPITETLVTTWIVMLVIIALCIFLTRNLKVRPTGRRQVIAEFIVTSVDNLVVQNMGEKFHAFSPFIAAILSLSALSSLSSMIGLYPPTADLATEMGWALLVFVLITYYKFKAGGPVGYIRGFLDPIPVLLPFNIISEIATPISMAFRHFGNIASGSVITTLLYAALAVLSHAIIGWLPGFLGTIPIFQLGIPAVLSVYFDLFSSCLQAFIFSMLTMMYISSAAESE